MEDFRKQLGEMIKEYRVKELYMTQQSFANMVNVDIRTVQRWERGDNVPSVYNVNEIFRLNPEQKTKAHNLRFQITEGENNMKLMNLHETKNEENSSKQPKSILNILRNLTKTHEPKHNFTCESFASSMPFKLLGENIFIPIDKSENGNVLVLGMAGSGKESCYIKPNLKHENRFSNFIIHTTNSDMDNYVKENLPDYDVISINIDDKPLDYFSMIKNEEEAVTFAKQIINLNDKLSNNCSDLFFEQVTAKLLSDAILCTLNNGKCSCESVFQLIENMKEKDSEWTDVPNKISETVLESVRINCLLLLKDFYLKESNAVDIKDSINKLVHNENVIIIVNRSPIRFSLYDAMFMNQLIKLYADMYKENKCHLKVILDEASSCYIDPLLFCVKNRSYNMSVDFIYQSINQLQIQYPHDWTRMINNMMAIVCLGTRNKNTIDFLSTQCCNNIASENGSRNTISANEIIRLEMEKELIYCPKLSNNIIIANKIFEN